MIFVFLTWRHLWRHCGVIQCMFVLFWYQWTREGHSYPLVPHTWYFVNRFPRSWGICPPPRLWDGSKKPGSFRVKSFKMLFLHWKTQELSKASPLNPNWGPSSGFWTPRRKARTRCPLRCPLLLINGHLIIPCPRAPSSKVTPLDLVVVMNRIMYTVMTVFNIQSSSSIPIKWDLSNFIPVLMSNAKKHGCRRSSLPPWFRVESCECNM